MFCKNGKFMRNRQYFVQDLGPNNNILIGKQINVNPQKPLHIPIGSDGLQSLGGIMLRGLFIFLVLFGLLLCPTIHGKSYGGEDFSLSGIKTGDISARVPFVKNMGQYDQNIAYCAHIFGGYVCLTHDCKILYILPNNREGKIEIIVLREEFEGENDGSIRGQNPSGTEINVFHGNTQSHWRTDIPAYGELNLGEIYPGIKTVLRAAHDNVEKIFVVQPLADPSLISLRLNQADRLEVNQNGELEVINSSGRVTFSRPVAYQIAADKKEPVEIAYSVEGNSYCFEIGEYDKSRELIIDPLLKSTYLGGTSIEGALLGSSIIVDDSGYVYVAGRTYSTNFPFTSGVYQDSSAGRYDIYISKFDNDLENLIASSYLGGIFDDGGRGGPAMRLSDDGYLYITGQTKSPNFPITSGVYNESYIGAEDLFVAKLSADLTSLIASTFIGSPGFDQVNSMAIDGNGNIFICGHTRHGGYPTTGGAFQEDTAGIGNMPWGGELFISKFDPDLVNLMASTFLGGSEFEDCGYLAIAENGDVYVMGTTGSDADFPIQPGAYMDTFGGASYGGDAFVAKFNNDLSSLLASTYFGGNQNDWGYGIAIDGDGNLFINGHTASLNLPTPVAAFDTSYNGTGITDTDDCAYIAKFGPNLDTLLVCTYIGGTMRQTSYNLILDDYSNVYLCGAVNSLDFPTTPGAYSREFSGGSFQFGGDGFMVRLNNDLTELQAGTYLGGSGQEAIDRMAIDQNGNMFICGTTNSDDFPIMPGAYDPEYSGGGIDEWSGDQYVAKFEFDGDIDDDSVLDIYDNCVFDANTDQEDIDQDSIGNACDNCVYTYNPDQSDVDEDGIGDVCEYICGDANGDETVNVSDAVHIINYVFVGGDPPDPIESGDCNCDFTCNVSDAVWIINYVFVGGNEPCDTDGDAVPDC